MEFLDQLLLAPDAQGLLVTKVALGLVLLLHLPALGLLIGGGALAVLFSHLGDSRGKRFYREFGHDLIKTFASNKWFVFIMVVAPAPLMVIAYGLILHTYRNASAFFLLAQAALLFFGCLFLYFFKNTFNIYRGGRWFHTACGVLGVAFLIGGAYHYFATVALLLYPEKWNFVSSPVWMLFSSNALLQLKSFLLASIAFTGFATQFFFYRNVENRISYGPDNDKFVVLFLNGLSLAGTLLFPIFATLDAIMIPEFAKTQTSFIYAAIGIGLIMLIGHKSIAGLFSCSPKYATTGCFLFLAFFVNNSLYDYSNREEAIKSYTALIIKKAEEAAALEALNHGSDAAASHAPAADHAAPAEQPAEKPADSAAPAAEPAAAASDAAAAPAAEPAKEEKPAGPDAKLVALGEKLYKVNGCNACHSVDGSKLVGPSFKGAWGKERAVTTDGKPGKAVMDAEYVSRSISKPAHDVVDGYAQVMPPYNLADKDVAGIAAYIQSLGE